MKKSKEAMWKSIFNALFDETKEDGITVKECDMTFDEYINKLNLDSETRLKLDELATACCIAYEEQGFQFGFQHAARLL